MPKTITNGSNKELARFVFYLNRTKHPELHDFLYSLPQGTVSNFIRDVLIDYIRSEEHHRTTPRSARSRKHASPRLPASTPIQASTAPQVEPSSAPHPAPQTTDAPPQHPPIALSTPVAATATHPHLPAAARPLTDDDPILSLAAQF